MEAGRAVMSSGSRAGQGAFTHSLCREGKDDNACRATWVLVAGRGEGEGSRGAGGEAANVHKCKEALLFHGHRCAHKITPLSF